MKVKGKIGTSPGDIVYPEEELWKAWVQFTKGKKRIPVYANFTDEIVGYVIPEMCSYDPPGISVVAHLKEAPKGMGMELVSFEEKANGDGRRLVSSLSIKKISTTNEPVTGQECEPA